MKTQLYFQFLFKNWKVLISVLIPMLVWEFIARIGIFPRELFPPISSVLLALWQMFESERLWTDVAVSLYRAYCGLFIGALFGISIGIITGRSTIACQLLSTPFNLFRQLPPVSLIPLMIVWFGIGDLSKIIAISLAVFFPVWINCHAGVSNIPPTFFWIANTIQLKWFRLLYRLIIPASVDFIAVGIRAGVASAFIMVFVSELAGASSGLGYKIALFHLSYQIENMIGLMMVLAICGLVTDLLLTYIINGLCPWLSGKART